MTILECTTPNTGHALGDKDAVQVVATHKRATANTGHRVSVKCGGNHHKGAIGPIVFSDGHFARGRRVDFEIPFCGIGPS